MSVHGSCSPLMKKIAKGETIIMDGALGTEIERLKAPIEGKAWSAAAMMDNDHIVQEIHESYIQAGAQLHIVNSFALAQHVLEPVGLEKDFEHLNRKAVAVFEQAVNSCDVNRNSLFAAGSLSTFMANSNRSLLPKGEELIHNYRQQAEILCDAGVDLLALEMLFDTDVSVAMLKAIEKIDLPALIGFTCEFDRPNNSDLVIAGSGMGTEPVALEKILPKVIASIKSPDAILAIMHSEIDVTNAALELLKLHWNGPVAIYPNSGHFEDLHLQFDSVCKTEDFRQAARQWIEAGVNIVGGCCGIGPSHIRAISDDLNRETNT